MSECQIEGCGKPLGHESWQMHYLVCLEHRKCTKCTMSVSPREVRYCLDRGMEIECSRCLSLRSNLSTRDIIEVININITKIPTSQDVEFLVKDMSFDKKFFILQVMQQTVTSIQNLLNKDKKLLDLSALDSSTKEKIKQPAKQAKDPVAAAKQLGIMAESQYSDKVAKQKLRDREKAIQSVMKFYKISYEVAAEQIDTQMKALRGDAAKG